MKARTATAALVLLATTAACGTTVPLAAQGAQAGTGQTTGLQSGEVPSAPGAAPAGTSTSGGAVPGSASGTTGSVSVPQPGGVPSAGATRAPGTTTVAPGGRVTGPLKVGILNTGSNAALAASFGKQGTAVTWQGATEALIRHYNAHGGIAGRKIVPTYYTVQTTSGSFVNDTQAACARFTQDKHVDVVMTTAGTGSFDNYEACLSKAGVVNLEAYDQGSTDLGTFAKYPGLFTAGAPIVDHAITGTLSGLVKTGYITSKSKIGVIVEDCGYNIRAFERSYAPLAKRLGITVLRRDVGCVDNAADLGSMLTQAGSAVLPFRSAGVDRISFVSDFESVLLLGLSDQAEAQGWRPGYALTSASHAGSNAGQLSQGQIPQMVGVGNLPNVDTSERKPLPAAAAQCRKTLSKEGVTGSTPADWSILDTACDVFRLLEVGLTKSLGNATLAALSAGIKSVGRAGGSASVLTGTTVYGPDGRDGTPPAAAFGYVGSCRCFRYTSAPLTLR